MEYINKRICGSVSVSIGASIILCAQFASADSKTIMSIHELDLISGGASAVATTRALATGTYYSASLTSSDTNALNVSNVYAGVSAAGGASGAGAGSDGSSEATTSATSGTGPATVERTTNSNTASSGPGAISTGISTSTSTGLTYISLL